MCVGWVLPGEKILGSINAHFPSNEQNSDRIIKTRTAKPSRDAVCANCTIVKFETLYNLDKCTIWTSVYNLDKCVKFGLVCTIWTCVYNLTSV